MLRRPKSITETALQKLIDGERPSALSDEERESLRVWKARKNLRRGRKTGAMPKGPLKRLREAGWVALDAYFLRLARKERSKSIRRTRRTHPDHPDSRSPESILAEWHRISERSVWNRLSLINKTFPNLAAALTEHRKFLGELDTLRQQRPIKSGTLWKLLTEAIYRGVGEGLLNALDWSAGAEMLMERPDEIRRINDGCFEETIAHLRALNQAVWQQIQSIEQVEAMAFGVAMEITIRNVKTRAPNYCK